MFCEDLFYFFWKLWEKDLTADISCENLKSRLSLSAPIVVQQAYGKWWK